MEKFKADYQKVMNNNDMGRKRKVNSFDVLLGGKPATQTPYVAERWQMLTSWPNTNKPLNKPPYTIFWKVRNVNMPLLTNQHALSL